MPGGVDPTGYVKGWAAHDCHRGLRGNGHRRRLGQRRGDIASFGGPAGRGISGGIRTPSRPTSFACVVDLAEPGHVGRLRAGAHLINPHTASVGADGVASVSGPDLGLADALATRGSVGGVDALARLESIDGYEALGITFDGSRL